MAEIRDVLPTVSKLRLSLLTTETVTATGLNRLGELATTTETDLPGLKIEVVPYLGEIPCEPEQYSFSSKAFWVKTLAEWKALQFKTDEINQNIVLLEAKLADENAIWLEDILEAAGIESVTEALSPAYSDMLEQFDEFKEANQITGGLKRYVEPMQWNAELPFKTNTSRFVEVVTGLYRKPDFSDKPTQRRLKFEDGATRTSRLDNIATYAANAAINSEKLAALLRIKELKAMPQTPEVVAELAQFNPELTQGIQHMDAHIAQVRQEIQNNNVAKQNLEAIKSGVLSDLLAKEAVKTTVFKLIMGIFKALKAKIPDWAELDLAQVQARFTIPKVD